MGQKEAARYFYPLSETIEKPISEKFSLGSPAPLIHPGIRSQHVM